MDRLPAETFPRVLRRVWRLSDPRSRCARRSDPLDRPTVQQRFQTIRGDYWVCAETGQLSRDRAEGPAEDLSGLYDGWWADEIAAGPPPRSDIEGRKRFLERFEGYRRSGRLFEVGSGLGKMLRAAVEAGWRAEGNELSPLAAGKARAFSGAEVRVGPIESVELETGAYDLVLLNNVFEHLDAPRAALIALSRALRPGGALYLQTLDAQSLSLLLNPRGWTHFIEGHLHVPTLVSLRHYLDAAGLRPVEVRTHGFSLKTGIKRERTPWLKKRVNKLVATLAARLDLGHRVQVIAERAAPDAGRT